MLTNSCHPLFLSLQKSMIMTSTNYFNTFIEIAEDCPAKAREVPLAKGDKLSVANHQFNMLYEHPYKFTSDDVLFGVFAIRKEFDDSEIDEQRQIYFSQGQPCFRASPLTKRHGWGIHSDENGRIAMYGADTEEYQELMANDSIKKVKAMRSKRK